MAKNPNQAFAITGDIVAIGSNGSLPGQSRVPTLRLITAPGTYDDSQGNPAVPMAGQSIFVWDTRALIRLRDAIDVTLKSHGINPDTYVREES